MASTTILSDNGVSSGSAGIKTTGGNDGVLALQTTTAGGTATTAVTIDTSQNVGIGTASPTAKLTVSSTSSVVTNGASTRNPVASLYGGNSNNRLDMYVDNSGATAIMGLGAYNVSGGATALAFYTGASVAEAARIDSSGNLLVGVTSSVNGKLQVKNNSGDATTGLTVIESGTNNYWSQYMYVVTHDFYLSYNGSNRGYFSSSTGAYVATSDQRLKKNISDIEYGLSSVLALRPTSYHMTEQEDSDAKNLGFIAQEALEVLPESVFEMQGGMYGMDKSAIIPVLVKAIQEQQALITTLTERITALEAK